MYYWKTQFFYYFPILIRTTLYYIKQILSYNINITKKFVLRFAKISKEIIFYIISCLVNFFYNIIRFNQNLHLIEKKYFKKSTYFDVLLNEGIEKKDLSVNKVEQNVEILARKRKKVFQKLETFNSANEIYIRMLEPVDGFLYHYR